jgi:hypothetical protein
MCPKCVELDGKIARYKELRTQITDQLTIDGIAMLIWQMTDQKAALHPERTDLS